MAIKILVGIVMFSLVLLNSASANLDRSSFGENCNVTRRCISGVSLSCRNEVCECIRPDSMIFDTSKNKCLVLVGEKCKYTIEKDANYGYGTRYEYDDCVPNASCKENGSCSCNEEYFETQNATCVGLGKMDEACEAKSTVSQCRADLSLTCQNGLCQCDPTVSSLYSGKCTGLAGKPCLSFTDYLCVPNAKCDTSRSIGKRYDRHRGSVYTYECKCVEPFSSSQLGNGFCDVIKFGGVCAHGDNSTCQESFACKEGKCNCEFDENHQYFDQTLKKCLSYVWGPCNINSTGTQCTPKAKCVSNPETGIAECRCHSPYVENTKGQCEKLGFDASCTVGNLCDDLVPLFCRRGKCNCEDDLKFFDERKRKCLGLVGSICFNGNSCVEHAFCKKPYNSDDPNQRGQCRCIWSEGMKKDRTCSEAPNEPAVMSDIIESMD